MLRSKVPDYSLPESSLKALEICEAAYFQPSMALRFVFLLMSSRCLSRATGSRARLILERQMCEMSGIFDE
jgi:hypothetical protein